MTLQVSRRLFLFRVHLVPCGRSWARAFRLFLLYPFLPEMFQPWAQGGRALAEECGLGRGRSLPPVWKDSCQERCHWGTWAGQRRVLPGASPVGPSEAWRASTLHCWTAVQLAAGGAALAATTGRLEAAVTYPQH